MSGFCKIEMSSLRLTRRTLYAEGDVTYEQQGTGSIRSDSDGRGEADQTERGGQTPGMKEHTTDQAAREGRLS